MPDDKKTRNEEIESPENEALDATELDDENLEDAAGGGDILCNVACGEAV